MGFKLAGVLMIVMAVMAAGGYWYYNDTQERIAILTENNAKLETAVQTNEATIDALQASYAEIQATNEQLNKDFANIRRQNAVLSDKLSRHDLGVLGASKPGLVERVINGASDKAGRCFELLSGAELTEKEQNATSANSFNSECPWLYDTYRESGRLQPVEQPEATTD
jgi:cell division protein FtsB